VAKNVALSLNAKSGSADANTAGLSVRLRGIVRRPGLRGVILFVCEKKNSIVERRKCVLASAKCRSNRPLYQAASGKEARRVVAKVEFHVGELLPRVGFIVTNLEMDSRAVVRFYNQRGMAEQWIKEGKQAVKMTRLSCQLPVERSAG
jgi:hypothetical protein